MIKKGNQCLYFHRRLSKFTMSPYHFLQMYHRKHQIQMPLSLVCQNIPPLTVRNYREFVNVAQSIMQNSLYTTDILSFSLPHYAENSKV